MKAISDYRFIDTATLPVLAEIRVREEWRFDVSVKMASL
jgi:hypothetical protein